MKHSCVVTERSICDASVYQTVPGEGHFRPISAMRYDAQLSPSVCCVPLSALRRPTHPNRHFFHDFAISPLIT